MRFHKWNSALLNTNFFLTHSCRCRTLCQVISEPIVIKAPIEENIKKRYCGTHQKELEKYLSSSVHLSKIKNKLPAKCLKKTRNLPDDLYLIDSKIGKRIAHTIIPEIKSSKAVVIETNPGFGFITEELLKANIHKVHTFESTVVFRDYLFDLDKKYSNGLKIFNKDFFSIWKLSYQDRYDNGDRVKNMMIGIEPKDWNDDIAMNIIGALPNANFVRYLLLSLIFQYGIMTYGRCNLYICLPPFLYLQWMAQPKDGFQIYRSSSVLMQIFCDFKIIEKIPRKAFLPWDSLIQGKANKKKKFPHYAVDSEYMYLTRISFKPLPVSTDKLKPLWHFVRHLMVSRKNRIIPMLEKWIPGCGWNLIVSNPKNHPDIYADINIYTRIGDMNPAQILSLFQTFASWPEYTESPFLASMEAAFIKMMQNPDDGLDSNLKIDENQEHEEPHEIDPKDIENI